MRDIPTRGLILFVMCLPMTVTAQPMEAASFAATVAEKYDVVSNVSYVRVGAWEGRADLYLPYQPKAPTPTVVWFHGGGWTRSSKEQEVLYILPYLEMGWAVVNIEYRLASNALAPAAVEDARCAYRWVVDNATKYNFDKSKIVLSGISAGGHLAMMSAFMTTGSSFNRNCAGPELPRVGAVVNWFGPSDISDLVQGDNIFPQAVEWLGNNPNRASLSRELSPLTHIRRELPPTITIHGEVDDVIPYSQSVRLHRELQRKRVINQLVTIRRRGHGGFKNAEWIRAYRQVRRFLAARGIRRTV